MEDFSVYVPFTKSDEDERVVQGYASTEAVDSDGEIVLRGALKKALPRYMKFPTIREMHQLSAVGRTVGAKIDDKGMFVEGKVVDDNAWNKVKKKVYNGFSIGGRIVTKVGNKIKDLKLSEISLVDRPSNPETTFSLVKFDKDREEPDSRLDSAVGMEKPGWVNGYFEQMRKVL